MTSFITVLWQFSVYFVTISGQNGQFLSDYYRKYPKHGPWPTGHHAWFVPSGARQRFLKTSLLW